MLQAFLLTWKSHTYLKVCGLAPQVQWVHCQTPARSCLWFWMVHLGHPFNTFYRQWCSPHNTPIRSGKLHHMCLWSGLSYFLVCPSVTPQDGHNPHKADSLLCPRTVVFLYYWGTQKWVFYAKGSPVNVSRQFNLWALDLTRWLSRGRLWVVPRADLGVKVIVKKNPLKWERTRHGDQSIWWPFDKGSVKAQ